MTRLLAVAAVLLMFVAVPTASASPDPLARTQINVVKKRLDALGRTVQSLDGRVASASQAASRVNSVQAELDRTQDALLCGMALQSDVNTLFGRAILLLAGADPNSFDMRISDEGTCARIGVTRSPLSARSTGFTPLDGVLSIPRYDFAGYMNK